MKKNLLSIIILFLLIVNISLTAVMMFSLVLPNQKALALMTDVATVLKLELPAAGITGSDNYQAPEIPIKNVVTYDVNASNSMMIPLRHSDDKTHYFIVSVSLSMDSKNKGYKKDANDGDLSAVDSMIQDIINTTIGNYTIDDVQDRATLEKIKTEIILGLHAMYNSDFIFNIQLRDVKYS